VGEIGMNIAVVGAGYVGLVTGVCLSELGHFVQVVNRNPEKAASINAGTSPIYEPGLDELLRKNIGQNLTASTDYGWVGESDLSFICVGTPCHDDGSADLSMVQAAARSIGESLARTERPHVVVVKSTVPPGTTEKVVMPIVRAHAGRSGIGFAMNPEFLREGRAVEDFFHPDRIVIGSDDESSLNRVASAYQGIDAPLFRTSLPAAEMIKYASNAFLATKISYANEIGNICKHLGIDVYEVMQGVGMDHRISPHFLNAGAGFGGSCFPKDVSALMHLAGTLGENPCLLKAVMAVNDRQPLRMVSLLEQAIGDLAGRRVAVLGLAFKDNTDDIRDSRAIPVLQELLVKGARVTAYDPLAIPAMRELFPDVCYCENAGDALEGTDACLVMTEWPEFSRLSSEFDRMKTRVIIEGRRILSCSGKEGICW
jgi:UDPglucose 6-dehydrogenase